MTLWRSHIFSLSALVGAAVVSIGPAQGQPSRFDALANAPFEQNRPTKQTAQTLKDELLFQRATQTYLWAMPLLNIGFSKVATKSDESIDIWFGPTKPAGAPIGYLRQTTNSA